MDSSQSPAASAAMTTDQLRGWLRDWVIRTTGLTAGEVTDDKPMENFGLSSRDAVVLSGELENLLDTQLDATIAYEYPTISALAKRLVEGAPEKTRTARADSPRHHPSGGEQGLGVHDIAIVGMSARFPGAEGLDEMWRLLVDCLLYTSTSPRD